MLADANNFYVSCERLFNPRLRHRPVVVLSSNDGCVVSRSQEAKDLGVLMGEPWFSLRDRPGCRGVIACSSNFEFYGDISRRVMKVLGRRAALQEVYSVDECFLEVPPGVSNLVDHAQRARREVLRAVGIPVSIGVAPTKTLAKLGAEYAKKTGSGACTLEPGALPEQVRGWPVGSVWNIGPATATKLRKLSLGTVGEFSDAPLSRVRSRFGLIPERAWAELNGKVCLPLSNRIDLPQQIISSRSFGVRVVDAEVLIDALEEFARKAAARAARFGVSVRMLQAYAQYRLWDNSKAGCLETVHFESPEKEPKNLVRAAGALARQLFQPGRAFTKAGVALYGLGDAAYEQGDLFSGLSSEEQSSGTNALEADPSASTARFRHIWQPNSRMRTGSFTTAWSEVPVVKA